MKHFYLVPLLLLSVAFTSCSTYQYTARQTDVHKHPIDSKEQMASIVVDYDKQVSATSDYQRSRKDAIAEAEFRCIQESKIDVVVDPIIKIEQRHNPFIIRKRFKATITGYAGTYKEEPSRLEESKQYTLEEIEKYKLLYDPNFPQNYYQKSNSGDNYYFQSGELKPQKAEKKSGSVMLKKDVSHQTQERSYEQYFNSYTLRKDKQLRDAGIGLMVCGAATCLGMGLPLFICGNKEKPYYDQYGNIRGYEYNSAMVASGIAFMSIGAIAFYTGIPILSVGAVTYKRDKRAEALNFTLNAGGNGLGLGLTF
jgi:hypothetical protein